MKNAFKFIALWFMMIVASVLMPILTLLGIEIKMKITIK